jgi:hypothetical protein
VPVSSRPDGPAGSLAGRAGVGAVGLTLLGLAATVWRDRLLIQAGQPELATVVSRGNLTSAVAAGSAATVGALVASRRPTPGGLAAGRPRLSWPPSAWPAPPPLGLVARPEPLPAAGDLAGVATGTVFSNPFPGRLRAAGDPHRDAALAPPAPVGQGPGGRAGGGLPVLGLAAMPLYPEDPEIGNPLGVAALADGPLAAAFPPGALLILPGCRWGRVAAVAVRARPRPGAAPAALAGGRGPGWPRWRWWSPWSSRREPASSSGRRWAAVGPCCRWPPGRPSCAIGCRTWTAAAAGRWPTGC